MRFIRILFSGLLICLVCWSVDARAQDEIVAQIQRTNTPPTIDGLGDDPVWAVTTPHGDDEFFTVGGAEPDDEFDLSVTWRALWDDTNLYVLVEVTDDEIINDEQCNWDDDGVEFYIDAQNLDVEDFRPANNPEIPAYQITGIAGVTIEELCGETRIPDDSTSVFAGLI